MALNVVSKINTCLKFWYPNLNKKLKTKLRTLENKCINKLPILFNIFLNDLLTTLENSEIYNFADDNTISSISKEKQALLTTLEKDSEKAIDWFRRTNMIVNPEKFQSVILQRAGNSDVHTIEIDGNKIETTNSVDLLGIHIDNKLTFDDHIFTLCNKAAMLKCNRSIETLFR